MKISKSRWSSKKLFCARTLEIDNRGKLNNSSFTAPRGASSLRLQGFLCVGPYVIALYSAEALPVQPSILMSGRSQKLSIIWWWFVYAISHNTSVPLQFLSTIVSCLLSGELWFTDVNVSFSSFSVKHSAICTSEKCGYGTVCSGRAVHCCRVRVFWEIQIMSFTCFQKKLKIVQQSRANWTQVNTFSFLKTKVHEYIISRCVVLWLFAGGIKLKLLLNKIRGFLLNKDIYLITQ